MSIYGGLSEGDVLKGTVSGGQSLSGSAEKINVIKGESAYEIALLNGFKGTQAEWLESLNGKSAYETAVEGGFEGTEEEFAEILANGAGGGGGVIEETDPTVPDWAKQPTKPTYTASEVGAIPANTPTDQVAIFGTDYHRVKIGDGDITFTGQGDEGVYVYCENGDGTLVFYGLSGDQAVRLENIATPINNGDAANKKYVDGKVTKIGVGLGNVDNVRQYSASNPPPYPVTSVNGKTGAVTVSVPTQTSQLTNNSGFITKAVSDLTNYYLKSETLTKTEINALVSAIPKFTISVVTSLPTSNISETTVYLVKSGSGGDLYTEYIRVNNAWEVLGSQKVDLTGYAKLTDIPTKLSELENDGGYLTEDQLNTSIDAALTEAKESGEFDGAEGERGTGILKVTTAPASYTTAIGSYNPKYRIALSTVKSQSGVSEVLLGDIIFYSYYHYHVDYLDASYAYISATRVSVRGATGAGGKSAYEYAKDGGYTGTEEEFAAKLAAEYLTSESDPTVPSWAKQSAKPTYTASEVGALPASTKIPTKISELTNDSGHINIDDVGDYILDSSENWVFTLEDGSTVTKKVVIA